MGIMLLTLLGLSIATLGARTVPSLLPKTAIWYCQLLAAASKPLKAFSASCFKLSIVRFPQTFVSRIL
jgi:hypothetical protein